MLPKGRSEKLQQMGKFMANDRKSKVSKNL